MLPPVSVPIEAARGRRRPPPPNRRSCRRDAVRSHGLCVGPYAECSVDEPMANSSMLVLPRMTAPASRSRAVTVRVERGDVALEDLRAGRRLAALDRDEVLSATGTPHSGCSAGRTAGPRGAASAMRLSAASAWASASARPITATALRARFWRSATCEVSLDQLARRYLRRARSSGRHLVGVESRRGPCVAGHAPPSPPRIAGTTKRSPSRSGALAKASSTEQRRLARCRRAGCSPARWSGRSAGCAQCPGRARIAYWSRMWLSWPFEARQLLLGQDRGARGGRRARRRARRLATLRLRDAVRRAVAARA